MYYHDITSDDMLNGSGLRVCLWCSGCEHHCDSCQNPQTWDKDSGIEFDKAAENELFKKLSNDYISGVTFTGGDPLHKHNITTVLRLCKKIRLLFGDTKTIWCYTGYTLENIMSAAYVDETDNLRFLINEDQCRYEIITRCDVLVDGRFEKDKADLSYPYAGSTNQRVIDVQKSLLKGEIVLWNLMS